MTLRLLLRARFTIQEIKKVRKPSPKIPDFTTYFCCLLLVVFDDGDFLFRDSTLKSILTHSLTLQISHSVPLFKLKTQICCSIFVLFLWFLFYQTDEVKYGFYLHFSAQQTNLNVSNTFFCISLECFLHDFNFCLLVFWITIITATKAIIRKKASLFYGKYVIYNNKNNLSFYVRYRKTIFLCCKFHVCGFMHVWSFSTLFE